MTPPDHAEHPAARPGEPAGDSGLPPANSAAGSRGAVSAGHPLAVAAGLALLQSGGNAVDAAVAAQAACCVLLPQACGLGGDALLLVRDHAGVTAVTGSGRSAAADTARAASSGGASATVPGIVQAWVDVGLRWGRLPLAQCLAPAVALAERGFGVSACLARAARAQRSRLLAGGAADWPLLAMRESQTWRQPELATALRAVGIDGRSAFYEGALAAAIVRAGAADGGALTATDLAGHRSLVGRPVQLSWHGGTLSVQPPPSQGILLAMIMQWLEREAAASTAGDLDATDHLGVELTEAAFGYRDRCAADGWQLLDQPLSVDRERAARRGGPRAYLHTTGVAAADRDGLVVSSLVSVFDDFGSGRYVPEGGFVLNNRAAGFTAPPNDAGPDKRPVHTLAPVIVERAGGALALATPGADGQVQTLLQVLGRLRSGEALAAAVGAPRWRTEGGRVLVGRRHPGIPDLAGRGHDVEPVDDADERFGAVVAAGVPGPAHGGGDGAPYAVGDWRRLVSTGAVG